MEKKAIIEVIKENKGAIVKRVLVTLGVVAGAAMLSYMLREDKNGDEYDEDSATDGTFTDVEDSAE